MTLADAVGFAMPRSAFYRANMTIAFFDAAQVEELLDYPGCIDAMRQAMIALSSGERPQPLRQIFTVGNNDMFGTMPMREKLFHFWKISCSSFCPLA